jgi:hypothetical protein
MAVVSALGAVARAAAPRVATNLSRLAGGRGAAQRLLPRTYARLTGAPKPELAPYGSRVSEGFQEGLERLSTGFFGRRVPALNAARASRAAQPFGRPQAVGLSARSASYLPYAAPVIALEEGARRGYNYLRDRNLPEVSSAVTPPPSRDERIQQIMDLYGESIINPQMEALDQFVGGDWEAGRRERASALIDELERLGASRALGVQDAYGEFGSEQAARADAINRIAELQGQVSSQDVAAGQAALEDAIYGESSGGELGGLVPVSGALSDIPEEFGTMEDIAAREALRDIISSGIESSVDASGADRWGDLQARDIRADFGLQAFGARQNLEGAIAAERERREEMRMLRGLELEGGRGQFQFGLEQARIAEQMEEDDALRALMSNEREVQRLLRVWRDLTDPAFWRVGPFGERPERQLALYQSMGINDVNDFLRAAATGKIVV